MDGLGGIEGGWWGAGLSRMLIGGERGAVGTERGDGNGTLDQTVPCGQQQRVAVARALAAKPSFVLADEPTANLDSKSTTNLLDIMAELNQKENTTFVFSTHDQRVIDRARRVITLEDGKIVSDERR